MTGRRLIVASMLAFALILTGTRAANAQEPTPDPRMLLNLDLFRAKSANSQSNSNSDGDGESMLEQIRALRAMGYFDQNAPGAEVSRRPASTIDTPGNPDSRADQEVE